MGRGSDAGPKEIMINGVLAGEQETGWRGSTWFSGLFFLWQGDLRHQRGSDFSKVSELDGSASGSRTTNPTPSRLVPTVLLPLKSVA